MSHLFFMDESGHDLRESPCEVLAGICIEDRDLWNFTCAIHEAEITFFGERYSPGILELKGKKLLKTKTFKLATQLNPLSAEERTVLAKSCLDKGKVSKGDLENVRVTMRELTALAQAKLVFVKYILELCARYRVFVFASIVEKTAPRPSSKFLRKDYAYLFERFYYFLEDRPGNGLGLVVFDELERTQCHILIDQMNQYFLETQKGRERSSLIIPEPFFVHSHLTTAVQVADIVAYIILWGVRFGHMNTPKREELEEYANLVLGRRYRATRKLEGMDDFEIWSLVYIDDLRPRVEKEEQQDLQFGEKRFKC